jgi:uncharacterized membrane protein YozB (DUF420 family)
MIDHPSKADRGSSFYLGMACVAAAAAAVGFSTTYFIPLATGRFAGPWIAHVHGLLFIIWVLLLVVQTSLIRRRNTRLHRRIGACALPLAILMALSGVGVGIHAVRRDLAAGIGDFAYSQLPGVLAAMTIFVFYVGLALWTRKRPDWHKRMILLATITVLWPAWFRFRHLMPWLPRPDILLAVIASDSLIVIAMIRDRLKFGHVHPAYWIFGLGLIAEHVTEVMLFDTPMWRATARAFYTAIA